MKTPLLVFAALAVSAGAARAADWITAPSYFTHSPQTGQRVAQYSPIGPVYVPQRPDYAQSGYRHTRSSLQAGNSIDHMHLVEEWGRPVRPYGEWRYPYRPYSVPYDAWGPPFGGFGGPFNVFPGFPFFGGAAGGVGGGAAFPGAPYPPATYPPSGLDEVYPDLRFRDPGPFPAPLP
jgi:hypothetical protein